MYNNGVEFGRTEGIRAIVDTCKSFSQNKTQTKDRIINQFDLTEENADAYMNLYW